MQIHDWVEDDSGAWIVMEPVDGSSLRDLLLQRDLTVEEAVSLAADVAAGLVVTHGAARNPIFFSSRVSHL